MSNVIKIFDTTLRDGEQSPGAAMNALQKLEVAKALDRMGVDIIEAGFPVSSKEQMEGVRLISETVTNSIVVGLARCVKGDVDAVYEATKSAKKKMLHIFIATSPIHMEFKLRKKPDEVLATIDEMIRYSKKYFDLIEFSAEDASRSDFDFLVQAYKTAIAAGATTINVPDTVGYSIPEEFGCVIARLCEAIPQFGKTVDLSVHCHNDLGLANANALSAVKNGATQVECTINGIGERAGNTAMEEFVMALNTRFDYFGKKTKIDTTLIYSTSKLLTHVTGLVPARNKAIVGDNVFIHESGIHQDGVIKHRETYEIMKAESIGRTADSLVLGRHSGMNGFKTRLDTLGVKLNSKEQLDDAFKRFSELADAKKEVYDDDLFVIIGDLLGTVREGWFLQYLNINSGNTIIPTATIKLTKGADIFQAAATGDGPVDAVCNAIDKIIGIETSLSEYIVQGVSSGKDAQGEVKVSVSIKGSIYSGRGASTDVIEASGKAYLNAINKYCMIAAV